MMATDALDPADDPRWRSAELQRFNLALLGATGVGKSTLVNAVFGVEVAATGIGEPVTKGVQFHLNPEKTLGLYDFEGAESFAELAGFVANFRHIYNERLQESQEEAIHVVWYCIKASDRRFDAQQANLCQQLSDMGLPVILVITQTPYKEEQGYPSDVRAFLDNIEQRKLPIVESRAVPVAAIGDEYTHTEAHGLQELLDITRRAAPEGVRSGLEAAQRIDAATKRKTALALVATASVVAAGIGATPVPLADAALLAPLQIELLRRIGKVFNVPGRVVAKVTAGSGAIVTLIGRLAAGSLAKLLPGWGSIISAGVAGMLTGAIGGAWTTLCERHFLGQIDMAAWTDEQMTSTLLELFEEVLKQTKNSGGVET